MATSFKRTYVSMLQLPGLLYSVPLTPTEATVISHLCQRLLDTHRQVWLSLLWGNCSFLLVPGTHRFCLCPPSVHFPRPVEILIKSHWPPRSNSLRVLSPFAKVPGWASVMGPRAFLTVQDFLWYNCSAVCGLSARWLYGGASKEAYVTHCVTQVCCSQSPCPHSRPLLTRASIGDTQHSKEDLAQSLWGLWALVHTRVCFV